jgi:predicted transcriptional regulator
MRSTVDLPPSVHIRVRRLAEATHRSISATLADLVATGLERTAEPERFVVDPATGFPRFDFGRTITSEQVAEMIDDATLVPL